MRRGRPREKEVRRRVIIEEWRKRRKSKKKRGGGSSMERGRGFTLTNSSRRELLLGAKRLGWR